MSWSLHVLFTGLLLPPVQCCLGLGGYLSGGIEQRTKLSFILAQRNKSSAWITHRAEVGLSVKDVDISVICCMYLNLSPICVTFVILLIHSFVVPRHCFNLSLQCEIFCLLSSWSSGALRGGFLVYLPLPLCHLIFLPKSQLQLRKTKSKPMSP